MTAAKALADAEIEAARLATDDGRDAFIEAQREAFRTICRFTGPPDARQKCAREIFNIVHSSAEDILAAGVFRRRTTAQLGALSEILDALLLFV